MTIEVSFVAWMVGFSFAVISYIAKGRCSNDDWQDFAEYIFRYLGIYLTIEMVLSNAIKMIQN